MTALVDRYLGKFMSRKLLSLCLGIGLELSGHMTDQLFYLLVAYVGTQGAVDVVRAIKGV